MKRNSLLFPHLEFTLVPGRSARAVICIISVWMMAAGSMWAQPVWVSSLTNTGANNNPSVGAPSGINAGDLLVIGLMFEKGSAVTTLSGPAGWNLIRRTNQSTNVGMATFYKIATNSEPASYTFTLNNDPKWSIGISRITGAHPTSPIDNHAENSSGSSSASVVAPSVTTTINNTLVLAFYTNKKNATYTPDGTTVERYDVPNNSGGLPSNMLATYVQASAGATGTKTATSSEGETWAAQQIAIFPAGSNATSYTATSTWTAPAGVTQVTVECWGGGGRGGTRTTAGVGGGGGGGAYAKKIVNVTPGNMYDINVGIGSNSGVTPGGDSWFINPSTVLAKGGGSVADDAAGGASGGLLASSVGDVRYNGGNGASGLAGDYGGGGGSSAGTLSNGVNGSTSMGGTAPIGGGSGGNGATSGNGGGTVGSPPGGGGGGARKTGMGSEQQSGGAGANGQVNIIYNCPVYSIDFTEVIVPPSAGNGNIATVRLSSNTLPSGTYIVNYAFNAPASDGSGAKTMAFTSGSPGTGTFQTSAISNYDLDLTTITVTLLSSGTTCSNAVTMNNSSLLPIELLSFTGKIVGATAVLDWRTATEKDNDYMAVERMGGGEVERQQWTELGRVPGAGTTTVPQAYSFTDYKPLPGANYYRLRQVDYDGTATYHRVIALEFPHATLFTPYLFPNPARSTLTLSLGAPAAQDREALLLDVTGRVLQRIVVAQGSPQAEFQVAGLPAGVYFVRVEGAAEALRFVKE